MLKMLSLVLLVALVASCNEVQRPTSDPNAQLYVEMIARATLQAHFQKTGQRGFPFITILEDCEGVTCSPVHEQIELCSCRSTGDRFYHVVVEYDAGAYYHVCFDMNGNMGNCPGGTY